MAGTGDFFEQRREWSRWKHEVLRQYLGAFAGILGWTHPLIHYVDGFAGAGTYGDPPEPGSPIIAAELAAASSEKWPYELRCINIEPDHDCFQNLCGATAAWAPPVVRNLRGTFDGQLEKVLGLIGADPALFFLDPFGYRGMEMSTLRTIIKRTQFPYAKTEFLINFNVGAVDRGVGWLDSFDAPARDAFIRRLNALMGTSAWQHLNLLELTRDDRHEQLKSFYVGELSKALHANVGTFAVRTVDGKLKYHLIHAAQHIRGSRAMSEVICRVDRQYTAAHEEWRQRARPPQPGLFDALEPPPPSRSEVELDRLRRLADDICTWARRRPNRRATFGQLQNAMLSHWFGEATEKEYRAACKLLIREGRIDREKETGISGDALLVFC